MTRHAIFDRDITPDVPQGHDLAMFGMGCFRGPERLFWQQTGVYLTQVGYAGGQTDHPTPDQVAAGTTGHARVVRVVYDSSLISYDHLLQLFWEHHDPTQARDATDPDRSLIVACSDSQRSVAEASKIDYNNRLAVQGLDEITTQIIDAVPFWPAPDAEQQYLEKNPDADCGMTGTGIQASLPNPDVI